MTTNDPRWWNDLSFVFDPNVRQARAGEILVGLGDSQDASQVGIALNPKYRKSPYDSVAGYVFAASAATLAGWQARLPDGLASIKRVVLEDLSFDTCFSLLLFGRLLQQGALEADENLRSWCRYVNRWEEGYTREQRPLADSIAALTTVLGHSYLDLEEAGGDAVVRPELFAEGASVCLELISAALLQGSGPEAIDFARLEQSGALARARSHLEYEQEQYRLALQHGRTCQLSVPLAASGRPMLVDALFLEERNPSGVLKVFARNDRENTWTRRGFDVLGIHRPLEAGTGGDMTLSITPDSRLTLSALWLELERLEDERWGARRPRNQPRVLRSYENRPDAPNQPWWDDYGRHTLIAAPKLVQIDGQWEPGSRLDWYRDVLPAVWTCYSPIPMEHVRIQQRVNVGGKVLSHCCWQDRPASSGGAVSDHAEPLAASSSSIADCPTFRAWLKALSSEGKPVRSPLDLPAHPSYRILSLDGGFVLVHRDGATAFDDWTRARLDIDRITQIFRDMAHAWNDLVEFHGGKSLEKAIEYHTALLERPASFKPHDFEAWKNSSWTNQAKVLKVGVGALNHADPWPLNEYRALLGKTWGFDEQRQETLEAVDRIDRVTSEIAADLRERRAKKIQAVGAGLAFSIVTKELSEVVRHAFIPNPYEWQLQLLRQFAPEDAVEHLHEIAHEMHLWELGTLGLMFLAFVVGVVLYVRAGTRLSEH
ncbi:MAG: hypothetical protein NFW16_08415 [Candidatus Accumulibacter sp.]|uniref:hypothetical protein n=1 Tax=Accumulibacter sp. TaxID=2053492 RepID=UPI00258F2308|nr:hypothetical protein [Accumulibacter sp.]MCM8621749.1 hypothetical protein [Accumulibacter sp.]